MTAPEPADSGPDRGGWRDALLVAVVAGTVFFFQLGGTRLWDRDEPRNAGCAAEMLAAGDWIVPRFNDQLRFHKPVLTYWLMMSAYQVFGVSEFAARFWSAALGVGTCLLTWRIGSLLLGRRAGLLAGLILPGSTLFVLASRAATPDAPLIFCWTAAIWVYVESLKPRWIEGAAGTCSGNRGWFPRRLPVVAAFYGFIALGALAKGLAGVVPPMAIIGLFLMLRINDGRRWWLVFHPGVFLSALISMRPLAGLVVVLAIAGPWYGLVAAATEGEFPRLFFLREHLGRATQTFEGHSGGWWFYPLALLAGMFPWSVFAVPVALESGWHRTKVNRPGVTLLVCWIAVTLGLFSLASTKLPSYITPCLPAAAILTGHAVGLWGQGRNSIGAQWYRVGEWALLACGIGLVIGFAVIARKLGASPAVLVVPGAALVVGSALTIFAGRLGVRGKMAWSGFTSPGLVVATAVLFQLGLFGLSAREVDRTRMTSGITDAIRKANPDAAIAAYRCLESSWVFYGQRPIHELALPGEPAPNGVRTADWQPLPRLAPEALSNEPREWLVVVPAGHLEELQGRLGGPSEVLAQTPDFLRERELVLLRCSPASVETAAGRDQTSTQR